MKKEELQLTPQTYNIIRDYYRQLYTNRRDKGDVICISEVIEISPGNLDSSLCFFQSSISHDVLCI